MVVASTLTGVMTMTGNFDVRTTRPLLRPGAVIIVTDPIADYGVVTRTSPEGFAAFARQDLRTLDAFESFERAPAADHVIGIDARGVGHCLDEDNDQAILFDGADRLGTFALPDSGVRGWMVHVRAVCGWQLETVFEEYLRFLGGVHDV
jgi:hypothetical protein